MNILFWLYKSRTNKKGYDPLMMRITIESQRTELVTKIELTKNSWDHKRQKIKGKNEQVKQNNQLLQTYRSLDWNCFYDAVKKHPPIKPDAVKEYILLGDRPLI